MAHKHVAEQLQLESQTGRISMQIVATLLGGVLLLCSIIARFVFEGGSEENIHATVLAIISAVLLGAPLVWVAVKDLLHGHMHMNELVALAVIAAFAIGSYLEAASIAFFMIISVLIENRTALGAQASIEALIRITPTRAHLLKDDGSENEVEAKDLKPGDVVRIRPGDNVPADGRIVRGASTINQANITGESLPVEKAEGDDVFGGTINVTGQIDVEVTKAGADTTLGKVKDLIMQAERTRIPIMRMIDRYAAWYTPTILMIVGIVLFLNLRADSTEAWHRAVAMLVIACPCALILATPTAMVAGLSAAARLGVLVKSVVDLEAARNLTAMIFDKTGTLTTGELQVTRLEPYVAAETPATERQKRAMDLLRAAASVEQASRHPVAKAVTTIARQAKLKLPEVSNFHETAGQGVRANADGQEVLVGRASWLGDLDGGSIAPGAVAALRQLQDSSDTEGLSTLFVVRDGQLLGWIGLEDNARPEAKAAITGLRQEGLKRLIIVTGDRESVASRVAGQLQTEYKAEVLPHEKLEMVDELKEAGHRVCVVGDGVNDAPALAAGDISIAMGAAGSDVAIHSANIALMNNNLNRIPFLVDLSRRTSRIVRQNLIFGVLFIVIGEILAASGYVSEIVAAVLHVVSAMVVVFNSARLVRAGEDIELAEHRATEGKGGASRKQASAETQDDSPPQAVAAPA